MLLLLVIFVWIEALALPHDENKVRRFGKHQVYNSNKLMISPSEPPLNQEPVTAQKQNQESQNMTMENGKHHHQHSSVDKSVAGGGVILGGLAATLLVAIGCYIRATRRKKVEPTSPSSSSSLASSPISSKV